MSIEAITWALKQPIKHSSAKFVLVAIANCADDKTFIAWPSLAYLAEATGQDRKTVSANVGRLKEAGYIEDTGARCGSTKQVIVYRLTGSIEGSPNYAQKRNDSENGTVPKLDIKSTEIPDKEAQISTERGPKTVHGTVKEPSLKRQLTVKPLADVLPHWLPIDAWQMFDRFRAVKSGKGWTGDAKRLAICKLQKLRDQGHDPAAVLEQSVLNGWAGLFELKARSTGSGPPGGKPKFDPLAYVNRNRKNPSPGGYDDGIIDI